MTEVKSLHRLAMQRTDLALEARRRGDSETSARHFVEAYDLESRAASLLLNDPNSEPTRSILLRSAASLAMDCQRPTDALALTRTALAGTPPPEIAEEIREILVQAVAASRRERVEESTYTIKLDGAWSLEDFSEMPRVFGQAYSFRCAFNSNVQPRDAGRLVHGFAAYPWRGGYSAVNFYNLLAEQVPSHLRPKIQEIRYASPGQIRLRLSAAAAASVGKDIDRFTNFRPSLNAFYNEVHSELGRRNLLRVEDGWTYTLITKDQLKMVQESCQRLAKEMDFERLEELNAFTGNQLASLKILLSYFRRVRQLAGYTSDGKAVFPPHGDNR